MIAPVLNERASIGALLDALLAQTRPPDEIVIADGGSTDGTREILEQRAAADARIRWVDGPGGISENRNVAIRAASHEIIACTDAGCVPTPQWLEEIVKPFAAGERFVAGFFRPVGPTVASTSAGVAIMTVLEEVQPEHYLPAGNSQAFLKSAWERVGGFPEGMRAAEDTLFGERMSVKGFKPFFAPRALVHWSPPPSISAMVRKSFRWGFEDGRARLRGGVYRKTILVYWGLLALALVAAVLWGLWALAPLTVLLGLVIYRTRHKYRWVQGRFLKYLFVPLAHLLQMTTQSLGWFYGMTRIRLWYLRKDLKTRPKGEVLREFFRPALGAVKRAIRPLVPDAVIVRIKSPRRAVLRFNLDVVEPRRSRALRWIRATSDTVRVRHPRTYSGTTPDVEVKSFAAMGSADGDVVALTTRPLLDDERADLLRPMADPGTDVSVLAVTSPPEVGKTLSLPPAEPVAMAFRAHALSEVATAPTRWDPLHAFYSRSQAAGHSIALTPIRSKFAPARRSDPIDHLGSVVILAVVPVHDVGGGSRSSQMAQELVARGYHVTYVSVYPVDETVDLGVRYIHPDLETYAIDEWKILEWLPRVFTKNRIAILELPHKRLLPLAEKLQDFDFKVVYDLIDDWSDPALGGWGYEQDIEEKTIALADGLVGSAPSLVRRLEEMSGRSAVEVANGVNARLFTPGSHPAPADLPAGDGPVLEYHGSLYGDWFDWASLGRVAKAFENARVVVIGDEKQHPPMPANVHFLGLKPQYELPAYLAHTDVAMVPFLLNETTHAVSPLKVFEYLAMGVPVASQPLEPLLGIEGVHTDTDLVRAVEAALRAPKPDPDRARAAHGWGSRLTVLFGSVGLDLKESPSARDLERVRRPVRHYSPAERLVR